MYSRINTKFIFLKFLVLATLFLPPFGLVIPFALVCVYLCLRSQASLFLMVSFSILGFFAFVISADYLKVVLSGIFAASLFTNMRGQSQSFYFSNIFLVKTNFYIALFAVLSLLLYLEGYQFFFDYREIMSDIDGFDYDIDYIEDFRFGSIYSNPNQLAYLSVISLIFISAKNNKINYILVASALMIFILTQTRALILFVVLYFFMCGRVREKIMVLLISLLIGLYFTFSEPVVSRIIERLPYIFSDASYKFNLFFNSLSELDYKLIYGNLGGNFIHYDFDFGNIISLYGFMGGALYYLLILYRAYYFFGSISFPTLVMIMTMYGSVILNSRLCLMFVVCVISYDILNKNYSNDKVVIRQ